MARYHYAFYWTYGVGKKWDDGSWPGYLCLLYTSDAADD